MVENGFSDLKEKIRSLDKEIFIGRSSKRETAELSFAFRYCPDDRYII